LSLKGAKPVIGPMSVSQVLSRLMDFLPALQTANANLACQPAKANLIELDGKSLHFHLWYTAISGHVKAFVMVKGKPDKCI